jgi:hypothetical protein
MVNGTTRLIRFKSTGYFLTAPKLFQIFLKDPDDLTVELNFFGELIEEKEWLSWE